MPTTSEATATNSSATYTSGAGGGPFGPRGLELRGDIVAFLNHAVTRAFDHLSYGFVGPGIDDHDLGEEACLLSPLETGPVHRHLVPLLQTHVAPQRNLDQFTPSLAPGRFDVLNDPFHHGRRALA